MKTGKFTGAGIIREQFCVDRSGDYDRLPFPCCETVKPGSVGLSATLLDNSIHKVVIMPGIVVKEREPANAGSCGQFEGTAKRAVPPATVCRVFPLRVL